MATASLDRTVRIRKMDSRPGDQELQLFEKHLAGITSMDVSADGHVLTGCGAGDLYLWSANGGEPIPLKANDHSVRTIQFGPTGRNAVLVNSVGACEVWNLDELLETPKSGEPKLTEQNLTEQYSKTLFPEEDFDAVAGAFVSTGNVVVIGGRDGEVAFWNIAEKRFIARTLAHRAPCTGIVPQADSTRVASLGEDGKAILWNAATGEAIQHFELPANSRGIRDAVFYATGDAILTLDGAGFLRMWDVQQGEMLQEFRAHAAGAGLAAHPDGKHIVTFGVDGSLRVWKIRTPFEDTLVCNNDDAVWCEFSPDGRYIVSSHSSHVARIYDAETFKLKREILHSADDWLKRALLSPDGSRLLTYGGRTAKVFDVATGAEIWTHPEVAEDLVVSAGQFAGRSDRFVVAVRKTNAKNVTDDLEEGWTSWDLAISPTEPVLQRKQSGIRDLRLSPDLRILLAFKPKGEGGTIWRFDAGDDYSGVSNAACATFTGHDQLLWGQITGDLQSTLYYRGNKIASYDNSSESPISAIAMVKEGACAITGSSDGELSLWDIKNASLLQRLEPLPGGDDPYINALAVSSDSRLAAAGTGAGAVGLWDLESGTLVGQWMTGNTVANVSFSPDSSRLLFSSENGALRCVQIPRQAETPAQVAARAWRLIQTDGEGGDRQLREAVASLEQAIRNHSASEELPPGFQAIEATKLSKQLQHYLEHEEYARAAEVSQVALVNRELSAHDSIEVRFLQQRLLDKFPGLIRSIDGHDGEIKEMCISPDGTKLLTVAANRSARGCGASRRGVCCTISHTRRPSGPVGSPPIVGLSLLAGWRRRPTSGASKRVSATTASRAIDIVSGTRDSVPRGIGWLPGVATTPPCYGMQKLADPWPPSKDIPVTSAPRRSIRQVNL